MKETKYPGYAVKISRWRRLMMWWWSIRHPFRYRGIIAKTKAEQEVLDMLYVYILNRQRKFEMPPIFTNYQEEERKLNEPRKV